MDAASSDAERADRSVWDEPTLSPELAGAPAPDSETYSAWFRRKQAETPPSASWATTISVALAAGPWAVLGAFWGGGQSLLSLFALVFFGPIIEEVMKTAAAAYIVERRPHLFRSRAQILACGVCSGLAFAAIENVLYLYVYVRDAGPGLWAWRWTVCVALHTGCSFIASMGLARVWEQTNSAASRPDLSLAYRFLVLAVVVHGVYNLFAVFLELGSLKF